MRNHIRPLLIVPILLSAAACSSAAALSAPPPSAASLSAPAAGASSSGAAPQINEPSADASGQPANQASSDAKQTSDAAGVTIDVTWGGPSAGAVFAVQMDNHMIDLASVDLAKAVLTNDRGERLLGPSAQGGSSGHHRSDTLTFASSTSSFFDGAAWIQLELPPVGDTSARDFKWSLTR